jgi:hypothetical protein
MTLILSGTDGLSDVDGTAATPAVRGTDTNTGIFFPAADTIAFSEGGVETARFDSSGNFGLGVTPSAWQATFKAIDFSTTASLAGSSGGANLFNNAYWNGSNYIYKTTAAAARYLQSSGEHYWYTAPSGTAGNAISFTQVLAVEGGKSLALENATSQTGTGITFPATQSASSNANTLDDYEEGTWTPGISAASGSGGTLLDFAGFYTKIGNRVVLEGRIQVNSLGTLSGAFYITGLPFTSSSDFGQYEGAVRNQGINDATFGNTIVVEALAGTAQLRFHFNSDTSAQRTVQVSNVSTGDFISFGLVYKV